MALQQISGSQIQSNTTITVDTVVGNVSANNITSGTLPDARLPNTAVTAGSYGNSSQIATFTVDQYGRLTAAGQTAVAGVSGLTYTSANATLTVSTSAGSSYEATIDLTSFDTDDVSEGTNQYYTDARARGAVSVTDSGGDGSLSYNSTSGVFTYTGPSASEVRAHFSAGTGVTLSSGQISIGQAVATSDSPTFTDLTISGNLTVSGTTTTVSTQNLLVNDGVLTLNNGQSTPVNDSGFIVQRYATANSTQYNVGLIWDETNDMFEFVTTTEDGSDDAISVVDSLMVVAANGHVGINRTSPFRKFHVVDASSEVPARFQGGSTGVSIEFVDSTTSTVPSIGATGNDLLFNLGSSEAARINSSGTFIVGKNSTAVGQAGGFIQADGFTSITRDGGPPLQLNRTTSEGQLFVFKKDGTTFGTIGINSSRPYFTNPTYGGLRVDDYRVNPSTAAGANWDNSIDLGAGGTRWKNLYLSGTAVAGPGTTNTNQLGYVRALGSTSAYVSASINSGKTIFFGADSSASAMMGTFTNDTLELRTGNVTRMTLDLNGNIIVGKTTTTSTTVGLFLAPSGGISITGSSSSTTGATNNGGKINLINADSTNSNFNNIGGYTSTGYVTSQINFINVNHTSRIGDLAFLTRNGGTLTEQMRVTAAGNVGIGTTSPQRPLHVNTSLGDVVRFQGSGAFIDVDGGGTRLTGSGGIAFRGQASGASQMTLTTSGLLGIGTGSPTNGDYGSVAPKLHVYDQGSSGSYKLLARFDAGPDADNSGAAVLINHSNDRGLLIEAGREISDTGIAHFGIVQSSGSSSRVMTLKQGGNVGIGTTNPSSLLHTQGNTELHIYAKNTNSAAGQNSYITLETASSTGNPYLRLKNAVSDCSIRAISDGLSFQTGTFVSERMRIDSSGNVLIGRTSTLGYKLDLLGDMRSERAAASGTHIVFTNSGGNKGTITTDAAGTTYNTTSDRRLKENIELITDGKEKLLAMKPSTFNFIEDENKTKVHGFIAQEMQDIVPEAVGGDDNGEGMMSMDYGRITPVIVAALQDALKEIDMLKDRIAELEAK